MKIDKKFSVLCPYGILSDERVSATELRVYLYIKFRWQFFQSQSKEYYESLKVMGETVGLKTRQLQNCIKSLEETGYLEVVERPGKTSLYIPFDESSKK